MLALVAAALGLAASWWSLQALLALLPDGLPRVESIRINFTVAAFTLVIGIFTAGLAALAPAFSVARSDLLLQLRSGGRGVTTSGTHNGRRALVIAQVALAVTVVAAAGLLTRSMLRMQSVDLGLVADRLVFVELSLPRGSTPIPSGTGSFSTPRWRNSKPCRKSPRRRRSTCSRFPVMTGGTCRSSPPRGRAPIGAPRTHRSTWSRSIPTISTRSAYRSRAGARSPRRIVAGPCGLRSSAKTWPR